MIGKYLNDYSNQPPVPPGWSEWYAAAPNDQDVYSYTLNENGDTGPLRPRARPTSSRTC